MKLSEITPLKLWTSIFILTLLFSIIIPSVLWAKAYYVSTSSYIDSRILSEFAIFLTFVIAFFSLLLNLVLVYIAYKAAVNFDVKKEFHKSQFFVVSELSNEVWSTELQVGIYDTIYKDGKIIDEGVKTNVISFLRIPAYFYDEQITCKEIIYPTKDVEAIFPFLKYSRHPLLPEDIAKELDKLNENLPFSASIKESQMLGSFVINNEKFNKFKNSLYYKSKFNTKEFSEIVTSIKDAIELWLKRYGVTELNNIT